MKTSKLTAKTRDYIRSSTGLSSYLKSLSVGRQATPRSWLYESEDARDVLNRWIPIMQRANKDASPFGEEFNHFDLRQVEKFGPQGKVPPIQSEEAQEVLEPLFEPSKFDDPAALSQYWSSTEAFAREIFGPRLMVNRPLSLKSVVDDMKSRDTLTTNSGFPLFTRREKVREEEIKYAETGEAYEFPAIVLFRQYNGKLRPVWMYPMSMNLLELAYAQPLQEMLRNSPAQWVRDYVTPWTGYDKVKEVLTAQWKPHMTLAGGDTTKMDAHMRKAQMRLFYEIVKWAFQRSTWDRLYSSIMRTTDIPLLVGENASLTGNHGLASGSGWTQIAETVLTMFIAWYNKTKGQGIGDDFFWEKSISAKELVTLLAEFGLPANEAKQDISDEHLSFLQRYNRQGFFSRDNPAVLGAYYPTIRALNSSLNPEKFHKPEQWSSDMFCIRQFMILENCVDDPCFDEFLKFVVKGSRHLKPFAKQSANTLNRIQREARLIPGLNPSYNQEKREKPLSEFTSIKLVSQM